MHRAIGDRDLSDTALSADAARLLYRDVVRARQFDDRALALQRRGWMSGYPPFRGQEGSQVGAAHAMADDDWLFPTYRSNAMQIALDVPMSDILAFRRGHAEYTSDHDDPIFPQAVPIATQIPHATGAGMARNYVDGDHGVVCYLGDGATSEGDFHEGLNFAGVFDAPVVFFCENNNWAISLPRSRQTASATIAEKAAAYGFDGFQVDGNDPVAVYEAVASALKHARDGEPVLVESLTYRQGAHTTSDDPSRYREDEDLPEWRTADPLARYEEYLREQGVVDDEFVDSVAAEAEAEIDDAVTTVESLADPQADDVFDHVYAEPTSGIEAQRESLHEFLADHELDGIEH